MHTSEDGAHGDEGGGGGKLCAHERVHVDDNYVAPGGSVRPAQRPLPESVCEEAPLKDNAGDKQVVGQAADAAVLQKGHEEAKPDKHHDVLLSVRPSKN